MRFLYWARHAQLEEARAATPSTCATPRPHAPPPRPQALAARHSLVTPADFSIMLSGLPASTHDAPALSAFLAEVSRGTRLSRAPPLPGA